jgi:hypothetical protein
MTVQFKYEEQTPADVLLKKNRSTVIVVLDNGKTLNSRCKYAATYSCDKSKNESGSQKGSKMFAYFNTYITRYVANND